MSFPLCVLFLLQLIFHCSADHYKGGSISWKPVYPTSLTSTVQITFTERHSWTLSTYPCNLTITNAASVLNTTQMFTPAALSCVSSLANCTASSYQTINSSLYCTDLSTTFQISTGTFYTTQTLALSSTIDIAWRGTSWASEVLANGWSLLSHVDLTPINNKINTSPVTGSLPIFQTYVNELTVIQIIVGDMDPEQTVRCRWSNQLPTDECGNVCFDLPNAVLSVLDCAITWTPVLRAEDIANGLSSSTYVVAVTAEDFANATSTAALSSVAHQVLVYVSARPSSACLNRPYLYNYPRRNLACYTTSVGSTNTINFKSNVYCANNSIVEFISSSPLYLNKSSTFQYGNSSTYGINVTWTPTSDQTGLQPLCIAAVDNHGQTSLEYCVMIVVGGVYSSVILPTLIQGTAAPVGTVMATQRRFSIQATVPLKRTLLNGTFIYIQRMDNNAVVARIDCKYSPDVYFLNNTLVFFVTNPTWVLGVTYYITMTEGAVTGNLYCGAESGSFGGNGWWRFTIWNPAISSTTTPSTTTSTATTHTVTTRYLGTTTYNTLYTTTGIPPYTTTTVTTTTSTTTTTVTTITTTTATTTTTTTTTTTAYVPNANVLYPKDMETVCLQPVTIATVLITVAMIPLHLYGLITLFVKMNSQFEQQTVRARSARRALLQSAYGLEEDETLI